jgi:hypothetical protein
MIHFFIIKISKDQVISGSLYNRFTQINENNYSGYVTSYLKTIGWDHYEPCTYVNLLNAIYFSLSKLFGISFIRTLLIIKLKCPTYFGCVFCKNHFHHLSRETSTAGHKRSLKFSTTIGPSLPSSSGFPRPSPDRRSILCVCVCGRGGGWVTGTSSAASSAVRGRHSRTYPPQRPSVLLAMCPAHCYLSSFTDLIVSDSITQRNS